MKLKWAWILGFVGIAGSTILVVKEHLSLEHSRGVDWLIPAFKYFDYPGFLTAPWIVEHSPLITHGDLSPNMTEVRICDGLYVLFSGVEWFAVGALIILLARKLQR